MSSTRERIDAALEGLVVTHQEARDGMPTLAVRTEDAREICRRLRDRAGFEACTLITATDRFPETPRFELTWQLQSLTHSDRVRLHAFAAGDPPTVPSVTELWIGAEYYERECWDLMGVGFEGFSDFHGRDEVRRLLMPEAFEHHPLRKDFPHQGIEPDKLYKRWDAERRVGGSPR